VQTEVAPRFDPLLFRLVRRHAPVVVTAHDPVPHEGGVRELQRESHRWRAADAVIIHGREPYRLVETSAGSTPVFVVPVDLPLGHGGIGRDKARAELGLLPGPIALFFGLLRPYKGLGIVADAWPSVAAALPDARLLVVGDTLEEMPELTRLAAAPGVEIRRGFVPEDQVDTWAAAADVILLPYHHGSHSGVLHRGLVNGVPVLASPPLAEEVHRTNAGVIVPLVGEAWADAMIDALSTRVLPAPPNPTGALSAENTEAVYHEVIQCWSNR
jgi:glycosyltransferase involved in cell wall biosynthesis